MSFASKSQNLFFSISAFYLKKLRLFKWDWKPTCGFQTSSLFSSTFSNQRGLNLGTSPKLWTRTLFYSVTTARGQDEPSMLGQPTIEWKNVVPLNAGFYFIKTQPSANATLHLLKRLKGFIFVSHALRWHTSSWWLSIRSSDNLVFIGGDCFILAVEYLCSSTSTKSP